MNVSVKKNLNVNVNKGGEKNNNKTIITAKETERLINNGEVVQVIDTRVNKQCDESHVDTVVNIPHSKLGEVLEKIDK